MKPILFLDVDGVLNPFESIRNPPEGYTLHRMTPTGFPSGLKVLLNHGHGAKLLELPVDIVWGTTWEEEANEWIGPHIGLPDLPVVEFGASPKRSDSRTHWKTEKLIEYADGRPFIWLDDECTTWDRQFIEKHHPGTATTHLANARTGLTSGDFWQLNRKAKDLGK